MSGEGMPGLELVISSAKAVEAAAAFSDALEKAARAVEGVGTALDVLDAKLVRAGKGASAAAAPLKAVGDAGADAGRKLTESSQGAQQYERRLGTLRGSTLDAVKGQKALADAGRGTAAVLRLLGDSGVARELANLTGVFASATAASRAFGGALGSVPLGTLAVVAGTAGAAFLLMGDNAGDAAIRVKRLADESREAVAAARRLDEIRKAIVFDGDARAGELLVADLRTQINQLDEKLRLGIKQVAADDVLGAIKIRAPETVAAITLVMDEMRRFGEAGKEAPAAVRTRFQELANTIDERFGVRIRAAGESVDGFFSAFSGVKGRTAVKDFVVDAQQAARAVGIVFDTAVGKAKAAVQAIADTNRRSEELRVGIFPREAAKPEKATRQSVDRGPVDALEKVLQLRERDLALLGKTEEQQQRVRIVNEAYAAAMKNATLPTIEQGVRLAAILAVHEQINSAQAEGRRVSAVAEIIAKLERENDLLREQGVAREALRTKQETGIALSRIEGGATADEIARIDELLARKRDLLALEEERKQLLAQTADDSKRLTEGQVAAAEAAQQFGSAAGNALSRIVVDGMSAREAIGLLIQDLARAVIQALVTKAIVSVVNSAVGVPIAMQNGGILGGGVPAPMQSGGTIPAMSGSMLTDYGFLQRGNRTYTVAEGGATTPEAIFPLQRDSKGRLGVSVADPESIFGSTSQARHGSSERETVNQNYGHNITVSMPGARFNTHADRRAAHMTTTQAVRRALAGAGVPMRQRRGIRPPGV